MNVPRASHDGAAPAELEADPPSGFASSSRAPSGAKSAARRPIVVVDDDAVSRHVLSAALTRAGLDHVTLGSGAGAISYLATHEVELLLLDLVMPDPDGYELLRRLRADPKTAALPIVVLTGVDAEDEVTRAFTAGADDFVKKPFRADELVARVRGQLRLRAVQSELRHRERDLEVVLELTQVLASNLDVRGILQTVVQRTAEVAEIDRVSIVLAHNDTSHGVVVAASDDDSIRDLPIALDRYPEISEVLRTAEPLVIDDAQSHPLFLELEPGLFPSAFRSLVILPIAYDDKPFGVLFLRAQDRRTFTAREIGLCRTVASAMAIALSNARRFQHLHEQTQQVAVERFEAERKIQSLQRFADFFESSADGMVVVDKLGSLLFSNRRAREITGFAEIDFVGRPLLEVVRISGEHWEEARQAFRDDEYPSDVDLKLTTSWGEERIVSANFSPVLHEEGFILCAFRDVTEARGLEAELVKTKEYLQRVIDSSFDAIVSADTHGKLVLYNRAAERLFGYPAAEVVGQHLGKFYPLDSARSMMRLMRDGSGQVEGAKIDIVHPDGTTIPVSFSGALVRDGERVLGSLGVYTDLRAQRQMEKKLEEAQAELLLKERRAAVAALAGAAAHELNQPLQSVLGYTELLERKIERGDLGEARRSLDVIHGEVERMAEIVRKIGTITRYETKAYVGEAEILDLDLASVPTPEDG